MNRPQLAMIIAGVLLIAAGDALADSIAKRVESLDEGRVTMTFESRDGVCGNGRGSIAFGHHRHSIHRGDGHFIHTSDDDDSWWEDDCIEGPVHVMMRVHDGRVTSVRVRVGDTWHRDGVTDLGMVEPQDAVDFLLTVVRGERSDAAEEAILPTLLARDVEVWPDLLKIARDRSVEEDARKACVFWLGQIAGEKATAGLAELVDDDDTELEVRKAAVFALSQQDNSDSVDQLVEIARTNRHPQIRRTALFWLAESDDPRVLDVFEAILTGSN